MFTTKITTAYLSEILKAKPIVHPDSTALREYLEENKQRFIEGKMVVRIEYGDGHHYRIDFAFKHCKSWSPISELKDMMQTDIRRGDQARSMWANFV
jgi:hypothetical protein